MLENPKRGWRPTAAFTESDPHGFLKIRKMFIYIYLTDRVK